MLRLYLSLTLTVRDAGRQEASLRHQEVLEIPGVMKWSVMKGFSAGGGRIGWESRWNGDGWTSGS